MLPASAPSSASPAAQRVRRIGCVSYLNAKPLIEGLDGRDDPLVRFDVPSRLLEDLLAGEVDIALCPVVDYFRASLPLEIVPVGGIGCRGPTLTVRLFSRVPLDAITAVHADTDSHTSVVLMRVLLAKRLGLRPRLISYDARQHAGDGTAGSAEGGPQTLLLIGDKVVTDCPPADVYPHEIDLGESWHALTGMPFVFAVWLTRAGTDLGDLPALLESQRIANSRQIPEIVARHAGPHGWPADLAQKYLGHLLRFAVGEEELRAIERFGAMAHKLGIFEELRPLRIRSAEPR